MNEAQRLHYLDALGIEQFVPTRVLPHAAELRLCELPVKAIEADIQEKALEIENPAQRVLPQAANALHDLIDRPQVQARDKPQLAKGILEELDLPGAEDLAKRDQTKKHPQTEQNAAASNIAELQAQAAVNAPDVKEPDDIAPGQAEAKFQLAIWQLQNGILLVDSHEPRSALPTENLLANILLSKNLLRLQLPRAKLLSWPLPGSTSDQGWEAARDYVASFVEAATETQALNSCIAMGEAALQALGGQAQLYEVEQLATYSTPALYLPSLVQILREPACKANVWKGLNTLLSKIDLTRVG